MPIFASHFCQSHSFNPLSTFGNDSNVRVSPDYSNSAPSRPIQSFRRPGKDITPSNFRRSAHDIAMPEDMPLEFMHAVVRASFHKDCSTLQSQMCEVSTDDSQLGNDFSDPICHVYQEDTINPRTVPLAGCLGPLFDSSLTGPAPGYMTGRPKTWAQRSVGARFHTPGQKDPASADDESSVPALFMGYPKLSQTILPGKNPHMTAFQNVISSEESKQINTQYKTRDHLFGASSSLIPENIWSFLSEELSAASTQSQSDLQSTHQPWPIWKDESSSQHISTHGPEPSPAFNSNPPNPRRRKLSPAVIEQRNDPQEAMSQTLDSYMVPTNPPKRRRLTEEERVRVAYVRKMKACPSCRQKHQKCNHVPDANSDSHQLSPESTGPETPASDMSGAVQAVSPSPGLHSV